MFEKFYASTIVTNEYMLKYFAQKSLFFETLNMSKITKKRLLKFNYSCRSSTKVIDSEVINLDSNVPTVYTDGACSKNGSKLAKVSLFLF